MIEEIMPYSGTARGQVLAGWPAESSRDDVLLEGAARPERHRSDTGLFAAHHEVNDEDQ
jgi:hypothetical protein